jgi:hypothetical protein
MKYDRGNAYDDDEDDLADRKIKNRKLNKKRLKNDEDIDSFHPNKKDN